MAESDLNDLIRDLDHPSWEVREMACTDLAQSGMAEAVPHLGRRLTDPVGAVRYAAAEALGRIGTDGIFAPLVTCLDNPLFGSYAPVLEALGNLKRLDTVPIFLRYLRDSDSRTRGVANTALMVTTGKSMGFRTNAPDDQREAAVLKWEEWYQHHLHSMGMMTPAPTESSEPATEAALPPGEGASRAPARHTAVSVMAAGSSNGNGFAQRALREAQGYAITYASVDAAPVPAEFLAAGATTDWDNLTDNLHALNPVEDNAPPQPGAAAGRPAAAGKPAQGAGDMFAAFFSKAEQRQAGPAGKPAQGAGKPAAAGRPAQAGGPAAAPRNPRDNRKK
jgi:hypothetical protein